MSGMFTDYYSYAKGGQMFNIMTAAAGVILPASNSTSPTFGLWNQSTINNAVILQIKFGWVGTTGTPGSIIYNALQNAGTGVGGTGSPITAATTITPVNVLLGKGNNSTMKGTSAATLTAAGSVIGQAGMSALTTTGATTSAPMFTLIDDIDGKLIVTPQTYFYCTGSAGLGSSMTCSITYIELPA